MTTEKKTINIESPPELLSRGASLLLKQYLYNEKNIISSLH